MKIVLTHTGSPIPEYTEYCVKQLQFTNPTLPVTMIADEKYGGEDFCKKNNIYFYPIEELESSTLVQDFRKVSWFKAWGKPNTVYPSPDNFVQGTSERLVLLAEYMAKSKSDSDDRVWHFENDNLVYVDLDRFTPHLDSVDPTVCYMNEKHSVWNFIHIPNFESIYRSMEWYISQLGKGNDWLCKTYGLDMIHEMTLMRQYPHLKYFPSIPNQDTPIADYYVDPASYGQFIAGTNNGHGPGFTDTVNHVIVNLNGQKWHNVIFNTVVRAPFIIYLDSALYFLANLHMHNKTRMKDFVSYE